MKFRTYGLVRKVCKYFEKVVSKVRHYKVSITILNAIIIILCMFILSNIGGAA